MHNKLREGGIVVRLGSLGMKIRTALLVAWGLYSGFIMYENSSSHHSASRVVSCADFPHIHCHLKKESMAQQHLEVWRTVHSKQGSTWWGPCWTGSERDRARSTLVPAVAPQRA